MSDDEIASSGDDVDDLFDSESEEECSEQEQSVDLSALSLASLQAAIADEIHESGDKNDGASPHDASLLTIQSQISGFGINDEVLEGEAEASTSLLIHVNDEANLEHVDDPNERGAEDGEGDSDDNGGEADPDGGDGDSATKEDAAGENTRSSERPVAALFEPDATTTPNADRQEEQEDEQSAGDAEDDDEDDSNIVREAQLDGAATPTLETGQLQVSDDTPSQNEAREVVVNDNVASVDDPNAYSPPTPEKVVELAMGDDLDPGVDQVRCTPEDDAKPGVDNLERGIPASLLPPAPQPPTKSQVYTLEALFPVVYERPPAPSVLTYTPKTTNLPFSGTTAPHQISHDPVHPVDRRRSPASHLGSRLAALQSQVEASNYQLQSSTRAFKLQLSLVESDNKKLSQRNSRLKSQLTAVTTDLQRSKSEVAKLQAENELYAAKLPRLQAELLEETSQVDETLAQSTQSQLVLTQLKARAHVLQTRNSTLEKQGERLTQQLRECRRQLKHKTSGLQQQLEKTSALQGAMGELKAAHVQELLAWKGRLTSALQRFEHEKAKHEAEWKRRDQQELAGARSRAEQAVKKRREAEAAALRLEEKIRQLKRDLALANDNIQRQTKETRTLEGLLRKAHRTEATLQNCVSTWKSRARRLEEENKRRVTRPEYVTRSRRQAQQIPVELLLPLSDDSDDDNQEERYCALCLGVVDTEKREDEVTLAAPHTPCPECPAVQSQLHQAQEELRRVRALHTAELRAQAKAFEACLPSPMDQQ